ncbi:hypothetical protein DET48_15012 [Vibrio diazotrophicus]|uniref:Uncharacterized protein n=2 Tax=Vibrio diazotrophicus TaxID=685 RepID=A0A329DWM7_VIBDI|nr:hypothetical protein DET48_15012 [Vibrio diazotrophicus]
MKTKVVYCWDDVRQASARHIENTQFDFLGYTFRARNNGCKRTGVIYNRLLPAARMAAKKAMQRKVKGAPENAVQLRTVKPNGWINYYGKFRQDELDSVLRHFNKTLVRWPEKEIQVVKMSQK